MPQIDENQASPAADSMVRRASAMALDLLLVALPGLLVALVSAERFAIEAVVDGRARFGSDDQQRINEIDGSLNRALQLGDTVYTLSGLGLFLTLFVVGLLTAVVFFLVPGLRRGLTPGRSLLNLPARPEDSSPAEVLSVSIVEPTTSTGPAAATMMTGRAADRTTTGNRRAPRGSDPTVEPGDDLDDDVAIDERLMTANPDITKPGPTKAPTDAQSSQADAEPASTTRSPDAESPDTKSPDAESRDTPGGSVVSTEAGSAEANRRTITEAATAAAPTDQVTLGDDDDYASWDQIEGVNLTDDEEHRNTGRGSFDTLTLPESSLSETPLTATSGRGAGATADDRTTERSVSPVATLATPSDEQADADLRADGDCSERADDDEPTVTEGGSATSPIWNARWQAWVFFDAESNRWFRHDETTDRWLPIN